MRAMIGARVPGLDGPLVDAVTCLYTEVPDHHFLVALHPRHDEVVIASPCSGHGFKFCSVIGEICADLVTRGTTSHDISLFGLSRFAEGAAIE